MVLSPGRANSCSTASAAPAREPEPVDDGVGDEVAAVGRGQRGDHQQQRDERGERLGGRAPWPGRCPAGRGRSRRNGRESWSPTAGTHAGRWSASVPLPPAVDDDRASSRRQTRAFVFRASYSDCEMAPASSIARAWAIWSTGVVWPATSPDVGVLLLLRQLGATGGALGHATAPHDQVDERGEERQEDQGDDPDRLHDAGGVPVPEEVTEDREHHHQVGHEGEADEDEPHNVPERHRSFLPRARNGHCGAWPPKRSQHLTSGG